MGVLRPVIQAFVPPVLDRGHHLSLGGAVAGQLVRDHDTRGPALLLEQLAEQALGGLFVPPPLDQDVEHEAILVKARQSQCFLPPIIRHTSSRCHLSPVPGSRRRIWLANAWPNLRAHWRTVSWLTSMPIEQSGSGEHACRQAGRAQSTREQ